MSDGKTVLRSRHDAACGEDPDACRFAEEWRFCLQTLFYNFVLPRSNWLTSSKLANKQPLQTFHSFAEWSPKIHFLETKLIWHGRKPGFWRTKSFVLVEKTANLLKSRAITKKKSLIQNLVLNKKMVSTKQETLFCREWSRWGGGREDSMTMNSMITLTHTFFTTNPSMDRWVILNKMFKHWIEKINI